MIQTITKFKVNWDRYDPDNHKIAHYKYQCDTNFIVESEINALS
jgi:hypothetical protein